MQSLSLIPVKIPKTYLQDVKELKKFLKSGIYKNDISKKKLYCYLTFWYKYQFTYPFCQIPTEIDWQKVPMEDNL
jgi:hypothetical protein